MQLLNNHAFKYFARAYSPAVGVWQVIMHHGSAYSIDTTLLAEVVQSVLSATAGLPGGTNKGSWARFYWGLRYGTYIYNKFADANPRLPTPPSGVKFAERLEMDSVSLTKLRKL